MGITSFEIAPQYVPTLRDGNIPDSIIENGYAFTDRYDFAMSKTINTVQKKIFVMPLRYSYTNKVFKSLLTGFQDQLYKFLPGKEVVTATRTDTHGKVLDDTSLVNKLNVTNTKSSGNDFQAQYERCFPG